LAVMNEFEFAITCVPSEDAAAAAFRPGTTELVILDYHLAQGNGLSCLHRLRGQDATVPIVAVSGVATPEIAAELLRAGADDYLNKHNLESDTLACSVRHILARTDALRQGFFAAESNPAARVETLVRQICATFRACAPPELFQQLDALEAAARQVNLTAEQLQRFFKTACGQAESSGTNGLKCTAHKERPMLLEMLVRLFGSNNTTAPKVVS
jgi:DNA-binding response OmpR family regulator